MLKIQALIFVFGLAGSVFGADKAILFDIDDTLVNTKPRRLAVLQEIGVRFAPATAGLITLELGELEKSCTETCRNAGVKAAAKITEICGGAGKQGLFLKILEPETFKYDSLIPGAVEFVEQAAQSVGAHLFYVTARTKGARSASVRQLEYFGFPKPDGAVATLYVNEKSGFGNSADYKKGVLEEIQKTHTVVAAFDDNLDNAKMFRAHLDSAVPVVHLTADTAENVPTGIEQITNYLYDTEADSKTGEKIKTPNAKRLKDILLRAGKI